MILSRVLSIDEAYDAVSWSTVFLLASLIPVGMAVQNTGTAAWIADQILSLLDGWPLWSLQTGLAVLATVFTLVMSKVQSDQMAHGKQAHKQTANGQG